MTRRTMMYLWGALLLLSCVAACAGEDADTSLVVQRDSAGIHIIEAMRPLWGDSGGWTVDPDPVVDLTLSGSGPDHEFYRSRSMKQRPDGSLVVANSGTEEVRVFSAAGEFQGSFGGSGDGPGEFRSLYVIENAADTLLAMESDGRVTVVAPDLTVVRTFNIAPFTLDLHYVDGGAILPEPRALVLPQAGLAGRIRRPDPLVLFDLEGEQIDSIGETGGPELYVSGMTVGVFFGKSSHVATMGRRIFHGANDLMQVEELDTSGNLVRILRIPDYPLDLSEAQIAAERDFFLDRSRPGSPFRQAFEDAPASDTRPAFTDILVDPSGAVWLQLHRGDSEQDQPQEWLVLDADGTWLGTVEIPDRFTVSDITMDAILGDWEDELDIEHPQVLRLNRGRNVNARRTGRDAGCSRRRSQGKELFLVRSASVFHCAAALFLSVLASCTGEDAGPPLVVQRDSAGIEIIEATRPLWGDSSLWHIDPEPLLDLTLSGTGTNHEFYRARSVKQRPDGSLAVADRGSQEVRVFSETGEFRGSFGGPGEGPGEFVNLWRIESAGDTLLALDRRRVTVVAPDLALVRTFDLAERAGSLHYLGGGRILTVSASPGLAEAPATGLIRSAEILTLADLEGVESDDIGETPGSESYVSVGENYASGAPLFGKTSHVAVLGQRIFRGSSDAMQVEELDMTGSPVRILRIPGYPLDLSDARIAAEREARLEELPSAAPPFIRQLVEDLPAPATRPAYADMLVDPSGTIWLELHRGVSERDRPQEWLILDADGTWLGTVDVPDRFVVMEVRMDMMLGVWRDELDVEHPQVLRLTRN